MIRDESGNVLVYILIGVALLAALSYAVAHSNRGNVQKVGEERAGIVASEIIEYGEIIGNAVIQLRLREVSDTQISFENEEVSNYENPNCLEDECKVFALDGGGVAYSAPKEDWLDDTYSDQPRYKELYFNGSAMALDKGSDDKDDLIMFIPYLKKSICKEINDHLGISVEYDETPSETSGPFETSAKFTGSYNDVPDFYVSGENTTGQSEIFSYYNAGCTKDSSGGAYHFFKVLISR